MFIFNMFLQIAIATSIQISLLCHSLFIVLHMKKVFYAFTL